MSKEFNFIVKPRYEYYKGTTEIVDNELDNLVDDVVVRLNEQHSIIEELVKVKQNQDEEIIGLQHRLEVAENKEIEKLNACVDFYKSYYISFKDKVIDELEKVKNYIITDEKDIFGANYLMKSGYVLEFIDSQIKELKGDV